MTLGVPSNSTILWFSGLFHLRAFLVGRSNSTQVWFRNNQEEKWLQKLSLVGFSSFLIIYLLLICVYKRFCVELDRTEVWTGTVPSVVTSVHGWGVCECERGKTCGQELVGYIRMGQQCLDQGQQKDSFSTSGWLIATSVRTTKNTMSFSYPCIYHSTWLCNEGANSRARGSRQSLPPLLLLSFLSAGTECRVHIRCTCKHRK